MIRLSISDFRFSQGDVSAAKLKRSWVTRLVDFLLGSSTTPHPIYTVGVAAGFVDAPYPSDRPRKPKPVRAYQEDADSEAIYCGLAGAGLASYGFVAHSEEHAHGRP
jgi:hypothetical protein